MNKLIVSIGDVKEAVLAIRAIAYFHKTVQGFLNTINNFTPDQTKRYCKLLVAEYKQFQSLC